MKKEMFKGQKVVVFGLLFLSSFVFTFPGTAAEPGHSLWKELDIVPMPKEIELTGRKIPIASSSVIVIGDNASEQAEIGADWINDKIIKLGGKAIPVVTETENISGNELKIIIGSQNTSSLVKKLAKSGLLNFTPGKPGKRGYLIRMRKKGRRREIILAGVDNIGTLYACVTLAELIQKERNKVVIREVSVTDWPDFLYVSLDGGGFSGSTTMPELLTPFKRVKNGAHSEDSRKRLLEAFKAHYDRLLRRKVSILTYATQWAWMRNTPKESRALIREAIEYGKERGVGALIYGEAPYVALVKDHPDVPLRCIHSKRYGQWIRCWSMDELRKEHAEDLAQLMRDIGITDVGFHDTDTGGLDNPARWNERCDVCRKRWGDDYVAATVHKHRIFYDALKKAVPDMRIHFTIYPYKVNMLDQRAGEAYLGSKYGRGPAVTEMAKKHKKQYEVLWKRMHNELPPDVTLAMRETTPAPIKAYRRLTPGRGMFTWYGILQGNWGSSFFNEGPRWTGTFFDNQNDFLWPIAFGTDFVLLQSLAVREYAWNVNAPGAAPWARLSADKQWKHSEPKGEIYSVVLPHVVRNFFGREAAPEITTAVSQNVAPWQIFERVVYKNLLRLKDSKSMKQQADMSEKGAKALDAVWNKCQKSGTHLSMGDYVFRRFIYLREVFHSCMWMAKAREQNLLARELAMKQDLKGAEAAIQKGLSFVEKGHADLKRLLKERPDDPVLKGPDYNKWAGGWRAFMADRVDMAVAEKRLVQTRKEFKELGSLGAAPKKVVEKLARTRIVRAVKNGATIKIDGNLDEFIWGKAFPAEAFFVYSGRQIARAHTRGCILYDDNNLYIGCTCWVPGREGVSDRDTVELFLKSPEMKGDYVHFFVNASGKVRHQRCRLTTEGGAKKWKHDNTWKCDGFASKVAIGKNKWELELKIPFASLESKKLGSKWSINLCRICPLADETESSSILPPGSADFHDVSNFQTLWRSTDYRTPDLSIEIKDFDLETRTLPDAIASVATFGVELAADQVIHNVSLKAEAYDASGKLHGRKDLVSIDRIFYRWESSDIFEIAFQQICQKGGVHLTLSCDEGRYDKWIRFGGWEGVESKGSIYREGEKDAKSIRATKSLKGAFSFPSVIMQEKAEEMDIFNADSGTVEFWVRPDWQGMWLAPFNRNEIRHQTHCFLHFGPFRKHSPQNTNNSPLAITHSDSYGGLGFSMLNYRHSGWSSYYHIRKDTSWRVSKWHHIACVWDAEAERSDWLRLYVDGKKVAGLSSITHEDRLGNNPIVKMDIKTSFPVQIGSMNSGYNNACSMVDELRISRIARYDKDFIPSQKEFNLDRHTSALFHFDGNLSGTGMTLEGKLYFINGTAGALSWLFNERVEKNLATV